MYPAGLGWSGARVWLCAWACLWVALLSVGHSGHVAAASVVRSQPRISRPVCRGLHKGEVDWWVMLKHPLGYQYSYMDSNNASSSKAGTCVRGSCWQHGLTMQNPNPVSHTLEVLTTVPAAPAAAAGGSLAYAFYNDADPGGTEHFLFAHAKVSALYMLPLGWVDGAAANHSSSGHAFACGELSMVRVFGLFCSSRASDMSTGKQPGHVATRMAEVQSTGPDAAHASWCAFEVMSPALCSVSEATAATTRGSSRAVRVITTTCADPHCLLPCCCCCCCCVDSQGVVGFSHGDVNAGSANSNSNATGFWLVHSAPRFPRPPGEPDWTVLQPPQTVFGQHFSCFSLASNSSIAAVSDVLLAAGPYIYSSRLPASLAAQYPSWQLLLAGAFDRTPAAVNAVLSSTAGQQLLVFAKPSVLNVSLTDAVVGPGLGVSMFWETWRRSHDALPSVCPGQQRTGQHSSLNIGRVAFPGTQYRWGWEQDHSKWGVSSSSSSSSSGSSSGLFVCLGDMNRAGWQAHRGGSYVCMQHSGLWEAFHGLLAAVEPCMWHA
jgi:hypothetical protein